MDFNPSGLCDELVIVTYLDSESILTCNWYLLSTYYGLDNILGINDKAVNKKDINLYACRAYTVVDDKQKPR